MPQELLNGFSGVWKRGEVPSVFDMDLLPKELPADLRRLLCVDKAWLQQLTLIKLKILAQAYIKVEQPVAWTDEAQREELLEQADSYVFLMVTAIKVSCLLCLCNCNPWWSFTFIAHRLDCWCAQLPSGLRWQYLRQGYLAVCQEWSCLRHVHLFSRAFFENRY